MSDGKAMLRPEATEDVEDPATRTLFSAIITPHRSLGPEGFRVLMVVLCLVAGALGLRFLFFGFWPVFGFLLVDVLGLYIAFKVNYARARAFEEVHLTPIELSLRRVSHRGEERQWHFNPLWTQLRRDSHEEFGLQRLVLVSRGQHVVIGGALSPEERAHFADEFGAALSQAKRGIGF